MSFTAEQIAAGEAALKDLERQRTGALAEAQRTFGDASSRDAALGFFKTDVPNAIDSLRRQLFAGREGSWPRWVADAQALQKNIADVAGYSSEWSLLGVLKGAAGATGTTISNTANNVVAGAGTGAGVFTFLLLGYIAWKVLR